MSWVTVIWTALGAACVVLGAPHLVVWCRRRSSWANLSLGLTAVASAALALFEFRLMRADTPAAYAVSLRWAHLAVAVIVVSVVVFVRTYLRAGRPWLGWSVCILRGISLLPNFLVGDNLNFLRVVDLRRLSFLGETVSVGDGVLSPWMILGQISLVALLLFTADATIAVWRRGDRGTALWVGGGILVCTLFGIAQAPLILLRHVDLPLMPSVAFTGVLAVMAAGSSRDALAEARLTHDLRESEARFRGIIEGAQEGIYRTSPSGSILMANPSLARMLGYDAVDRLVSEIGNTAQQLWTSPEERARFVRLVESQGTVSGYECWFRRKDGTRIWVSLSSRAVFQSDGRLAYIEGFVQDITARREAELALRESSARLEALLFTMAEWTWETDESGRYTYYSPKGIEVLGEVVGKTLFDCLPSDEASRMMEVLAGAAASRAPIKDLEHWLVTRKGDRLCLLANGVPVLNEAGEVKGYRGVDRDITERKLAEQALFESEERFRHAAAAARFGTYQIDHAKGTTYCSPELLGLFGRSAGDNLELDSNPVPQAVHPDDRVAYLAARRAARDPLGSGVLNHTFRVVRPDGQILWIQALGQTAFTGVGPERRPLRSNGIILDLTKSKEAELKLEQQRNELGHMARISMMGQLACSLAHELNQPLGAIMRNAEAVELFLEEPSPDLEEVRVIVSDIRKDDARAGAVIERMRSLMRRREIELETLDLAAVAAEVVALVLPDAHIRLVRLALDAEADLPPVRGDRVQLQQVVLNLLLNALDAVKDNPPTERRVTLQARAVGSSVALSVSDNGHGIPESILPKIFEPFWSSRSGGLGVGLSISLSIIEAHGGRLWAKNDEDGGARFSFSLPAADRNG